MSPLLAVPNVSEGRDGRVLDALTAAFGSTSARLLDVHTDPDHHRTVFTLAGEPGELAPALAAGAAAALEHIDLRDERGSHPHVGVIDVAPIVFLEEELRGAACVEALVAGEELGRLGLPVLVYGVLARGRSRAEIRRGGVGALAERVAAGDPVVDFGPRAIGERWGCAMVAARPPLIAFNLELSPPADVGVARRVAAAIREGGAEGLPGVRALGMELPARDGVAQVSTNVEDHRGVPLATLVSWVQRHAEVTACELVGLAPKAAFDGFPPDLEVRNLRTVEDALTS